MIQSTWQQPVIQGQFLRRYKRFFADVEVAGKTEVAHVANTGSLLGHIESPRPALVTAATNPERKLRWTLEALQSPTGAWVGVNTQWPNRLVREAFIGRVVRDWAGYTDFQPEVTHPLAPKSRLDAVLRGGHEVRDRFLEVKSVTMAEGTCALFPDAPTERGRKHLQDLMKIVEAGFDAEIVFVIQRHDCKTFAPAEHIDPEYASLLKVAQAKGVKIRLLQLIIDPQCIGIRELPVE